MSVLITTLGTLSMVIGVFLAIGQWDIKRLLAYHSISQMGYVVTFSRHRNDTYFTGRKA